MYKCVCSCVHLFLSPALVTVSRHQGGAAGSLPVKSKAVSLGT